MRTIKVDTVWEHKVAIRDKYLNEANNAGEGIRIEKKGEIMTIPFERLKEYAFKSKFPFYDRYSKQKHYLYYYSWVPDKKEDPIQIQGKLL